MTADGPGQPRSLEGDLVAWGKVIVLETRGRHSGATRRATVGFLEEDDGVLLVAAADDGAEWARNLIAHTSCRVERDGQLSERIAHRLEGDEHDAVVAGLILKYGTPAERQGGGPAFRLVTDPDPTAPERYRLS